MAALLTTADRRMHRVPHAQADWMRALALLWPQVVVPHSLSLAFRLGQAVAAAQHAKQDAVRAAADVGGGAVIFSGERWPLEERWGAWSRHAGAGDLNSLVGTAVS